MAMIAKEELKLILEFCGEMVDIDRATGMLLGHAAEHITTARLIVQRTARGVSDVWPHGATPFLELVCEAGIAVLVFDRSHLQQNQLHDILKRIAHEADFQARYEFPQNEKIQRRQRDLLGTIRTISELIYRREGADRSQKRHQSSKAT